MHRRQVVRVSEQNGSRYISLVRFSWKGRYSEEQNKKTIFCCDRCFTVLAITNQVVGWCLHQHANASSLPHPCMQQHAILSGLSSTIRAYCLLSRISFYREKMVGFWLVLASDAICLVVLQSCSSCALLPIGCFSGIHVESSTPSSFSKTISLTIIGIRGDRRHPIDSVVNRACSLQKTCTAVEFTLANTSTTYQTEK